MNTNKTQGVPVPEMPLRVRDRIFAVARELFSRQGIRAVGVDAIAEQAGTNKMSFYRSFTSKDALIAECVRAQQAEYWQWWDGVVTPHAGDPRAQIEALFAASVLQGCEPAATGCSLNNAAVELREAQHPATELIRAHKADMRRRLALLAGAAGAANPEALGDALLLLLEGGTTSLLTFDRAGAPVHKLQTVVRALLDEHLGMRTGVRPRKGKD